MMKKSVLLLSLIVLFQSCAIYNSRTSTKDDAIFSEKKVKVKSTTKATYKFEKLIEEENQLYGIAKKQSHKSKKVYNDNIVNENKLDKYVKILLTDDLVNEIHLYSKGKTNAVGILGLGYITLLLLSAAAGVFILVALGGGL